jgi:Cro/C1-type helix-turn-helix DNA-binding protein
MTPAELNRLLAAKGIGTTDLSRLVDTHVSTIKRWRNGFTPISTKTAMAIHAALGGLPGTRKVAVKTAPRPARKARKQTA